MKKHILNSVGKTAKLLLSKDTFYDFKTQISFWDGTKRVPVLNASKEGTLIETSTIENSDPDEFMQLGFSTRQTESMENSDADGFRLDFSGSKETRSIEDSDIDSFVALSSKITKSVENSDADGYLPPPTTQQTYTIENSDVDEFALA